MNRKVDLSSMSVLRARKGEAAPVSEVIPQSQAGAAKEAPPTAALQERERVESIGDVRASAVAIVPRKARERGEPRSPVTTRITYGLQDRLFRAATMLGKSQQALIEEAIDELLKRNSL